jgi:hypothetical protein
MSFWQKLFGKKDKADLEPEVNAAMATPAAPAPTPAAEPEATSAEAPAADATDTASDAGGSDW